ncbi:MAG: protein kinase [Muribaculaceae bacterium]|nr:protein kinase [Muribaculaceae bacterium]
MKNIANYIVEDDPIAVGGMGRIYKGQDPLGNRVAIKEILPEYATDLSILARIDKEVEFLMRVEHPSIVKLYSAFRDPQTNAYFIVMELVEGKNIEEYVSAYGPIPFHIAVELMKRILDAMQCVHNSQIVHRDIKPSNIMIRPDMSVCLLDFGVAKDMESKMGNTIPGSVIGTTGYMSPEQAEGYTIDKRSDIYALGCVFFFMLTGKHAYNTFKSEFETKDAILSQPFPRLKKHKPDIPYLNEVQAVLDKATDRNMDLRYSNCLDFARDIPNGTIVPLSPKITIGRGQCDIVISDPEGKVSRNHLEIELKAMTGNQYFILTDTSANGTLIGDKKIYHQTYTIPDIDPRPVVKLAGVEAGRLDWNQVRERLLNKLKASGTSDSSDSSDKSDSNDLNVHSDDDVLGLHSHDNPGAGMNSGIHPPIPESMEEDATGMLIAAYFFAALGGLIGVYLGTTVATRKTEFLNTNIKIYKYKASHRTLGWIAMALSIISAFIWIACA